ALMAINFYLHGRYLTERPCNDLLVAAASVFDLAVVTALVMFWHESGLISSGLASPFFVFYYPMLLAVAFVLPPRLAIAYTAATVLLYAVIFLSAVEAAVDGQDLLLRLGQVAAIGWTGIFLLADPAGPASSRSGRVMPDESLRAFLRRLLAPAEDPRERFPDAVDQCAGLLDDLRAALRRVRASLCQLEERATDLRQRLIELDARARRALAAG